MKLQQLRHIREVTHHGLNVSATAQSLDSSQSVVSRQIKLLEDDLCVEVFARDDKKLSWITPAGESMLEKAGEILRHMEMIEQAV